MPQTKPLILLVVFGLFFAPTVVLAVFSNPQTGAPAAVAPQYLTATPSPCATLPFYVPLVYKATDAPVIWPPTATPAGEGASDIDVEITNIYWLGTAAKNESDEYIELHNRGTAPFDLSGWSIYAEDTFAEVYFPEGFSLAAGAFCRVYTNEVHPDSCGGASFNQPQEVWPNDYSCGGLYSPKPDEENRAYFCY